MNCLKLSAYGSAGSYFSMKPRAACALDVALAAIALCGFVLSVCSIVSYLPAGAGYGGGASSLAAILALAIGHTYCKPPQDLSKGLEAVFKEKIQNYSVSCAEGNLLPKEVLLQIFAQLDAKDWVKVSRVCATWYLSALHTQFWEHACQQEMISPPKGHLSWSPLHPKEGYQCAKNFAHRVQTLKPQENQLSIPGLKWGERGQIFLRIKDLFIFHHEGRFEIWNDSLTECVHSVAAKLMHNPQIKMMGDTVYLIGEDTASTYKLNLIYLYSFNTHLKQPGPSLYFYVCDFNQRTWLFKSFEFDDRHIFLGMSTNEIWMWDLACEPSLSKPRALELASVELEHEENEDFAAETKKIIVGCNFLTDTFNVEKLLLNSASLLEQNPESHQTLQTAKPLIGHKGSITFLRAIEAYLFSGSEDRTLKQWDLSNSICIKTFQIDWFNLNPDCILGKNYLIGTQGISMQYWKLDVERPTFPALDVISATSCHLSGHLLFCLHDDYEHKKIKIYNVFTKGCIKKFTYKPGFISKMLNFGKKSDSGSKIQVFDNHLYLLYKDRIIDWEFNDGL